MPAPAVAAVSAPTTPVKLEAADDVVSPPPAAQPAFLAKLTDTIAEIKKTDLGRSKGSTEGILLSLAMIQLWAQVAADTASATLTPDEEKTRTALIASLRSKQKAALPILRDAYGPAASKKLWELDAKAKTIGTGYRTVEFVAAEFAANRNIKSMHESIFETLMQLRFTRAQYRWYSGADQYTYYTIEPPKDTDIVVWTGSRYRLVN